MPVAEAALTVVDLSAVVLGAALLALAGLGLASALRIAGAPFLLAAGILAAAAAIVVIEVVSAAHWVTRGGLLAGAGVAAGAAGAAWAAAGRPSPRVRVPSLAVSGLGPAAREHPVVAATVAAATLAALAQLVLAVVVVPNEVDGLLYHLLRSAMVVEDHTAVPFRPALLGDPSTMNPANAELLVAWTMVLGHTDRLAALVQWLCLPALGLLVGSGARLLGFDRAAAVFAGALAMLLPEPLLQATTVQTDLVLSVLVGSAALFAIRGLRDGSRGDIVVAGVGAGLAVGTKTSALIAAPFVVLLVVAAAWQYRAPPRRLAWVAGAAAAGVLVLGAFPYVEDAVRTGDPLGGMPHTTARDFTHASPPLNALRSTWSVFVEAPGLPRVQSLERGLDGFRFALFGHLRGSYYVTPVPVRFTVDEDTNGLGLVGLLALVPLLVLALVRPARPALRIVAVAGLGFVVVLSASVGYSPDNSRLMLPGLVLTLPLLAATAARGWTRGAVASIAVVSAVPIVLLNPHRSPFTDPALPGQSRAAQQLVDYSGMSDIIDRLNTIVPRTAPVGVLHTPEFTYSTHPAYALFDAQLRRRVVPLTAPEITPRRLRALGLAGAVVWHAGCGGALCHVPLDRLPHVSLGEGGAFVRAG